MKCVISVALLAFSQISHFVAATAIEKPAATPAKAESESKVENINYGDIISTVEKRFKVLMKLMQGEGFKAELLQTTKAEVTKVSNEFLAKFTPLLKVSKDRAQDSSKQVQQPVPSWIKIRSEAESHVEQAVAVHNALEKAGQSIHRLFESLFGKYAEQLQSAPVKANVAQQTGKVAESNTALAGSASSEPAAVGESQHDDDFLNLRFVVPVFANDIDTLYALIKEKNDSTKEEQAALLEVIKKWISEKVPSLKPNENMVLATVKQELAKLCTSEVYLKDIALSLDAYNQLDAKLSESVEKCKKMNSASFGAVSLLLAAVLAFTMW
ncbi:adenine-specific DNA-methyltransferase, putative [Babesia ovata]|uniref:Adenine-specific DNA-methyltransferase, putative n=1 Tax=Babesia ovata TaxID=189622 RepID=A0A2H6KEI7_9APIC|nr:adenine-specific DNA-methyltransferase, putative [Babesia ovata]GBE61369.1 adenine-specific DNA-methyltransferase, putative [Babesia ovata]